MNWLPSKRFKREFRDGEKRLKAWSVRNAEMWFCRKQSQKRNANHARNETYNQSLKGIEMLVLVRRKRQEKA